MTGCDSRYVDYAASRKTSSTEPQAKEPVDEKNKICWSGCHAETIALAVAEQGEDVRSLEVIPNREESIRRLVKKLGAVKQLQFCCEAGPTV